MRGAPRHPCEVPADRSLPVFDPTMAHSPPKPLLFLLAALAALGLAWAFLLGPDVESDSEEEPAGAAVLDLDNRLDEGAGRPVPILSSPRESTAPLPPVTGEPTRVLFPLELKLELLRESGIPEVPNGPALGSGRSSQIIGRVADARGNAAEGEVRFVSGPNRGRTLRLDSEGRFGANDLFPGLSVVDVVCPGQIGARREVRLGVGQRAELNLGFGRPAAVSGRVVDEAGQPLGEAAVHFDGQLTTTGESGYFGFSAIASGRVVVEVTHPSYAPWRSLVSVTHASNITADRMRVTLQRGAQLNLSLLNDVGGPAPVELYIVPVGLGAERKFNWTKFQPVQMTGRQIELPGLPPVRVQVHAFRRGALSVPRLLNVTLAAGAESNVTLEFQPAPKLVGRVIENDRVVAGARVRLSAADPNAVASTVFGQPMGYLQSEVLPLLPPSRQEALTGDDGRFEFSAWSQASAWRLLEVENADGSARRRLAVGPDEREVEVDLTGAGLGPAGTLRLQLPPRFQGLPVELVVDGRPRDPFELAPDQDLEVADLPAGSWRLSARWWDRIVAELDLVEIEGLVELPLVLPQGAIDGQDDETWRRSGRPR